MKKSKSKRSITESNVVELINRNGHKHKVCLVDENTIHFYVNKKCKYVRYSGNENTLHYFDPEGGPFVALYETASYCLSESFPDREIILIDNSNKKYLTLKLKPEKEKRKKEK